MNPDRDRSAITRAIVGACVAVTIADADPPRPLPATPIAHAVAAASQLTTIYEPPGKPGVAGAPRAYVEWMTGVLAALDGEFRLPHPLAVRFADCGNANAYYSPSHHTITMCHEFWDSRRRLFADIGQEPAAIERATRDAMTFTFFHEFGHALHLELRLPLTGRSEDAADEIATILLIGRGREGREVAAVSARAKWARSQQTDHRDTYWDEHSYSAQRAVAIACLLYGADKTAHAELVKELAIPPQRLAKCATDYPLRMRAWNTLLRPHVRRRDFPILLQLR